jgi:hypothetical protein
VDSRRHAHGDSVLVVVVTKRNWLFAMIGILLLNASAFSWFMAPDEWRAVSSGVQWLVFTKFALGMSYGYALARWARG